MKKIKLIVLSLLLVVGFSFVGFGSPHENKKDPVLKQLTIQVNAVIVDDSFSKVLNIKDHCFNSFNSAKLFSESVNIEAESNEYALIAFKRTKDKRRCYFASILYNPLNNPNQDLFNNSQRSYLSRDRMNC